MPAAQYFLGQHKNEHLVFFFYRHWTYFLKVVIKNISLLVILESLFLLFIFSSIDEKTTIINVLSNNVFALFVFYISSIILVHAIFFNIFSFIFDIIIVTDARFIEKKESLFFEENLETIDLPRMQDIRAHKNGVFENLFGYGIITITLASMNDQKKVCNVPTPLKVVNAINKVKRRLFFKHEQLQENIVDIRKTQDPHKTSEEIII